MEEKIKLIFDFQRFEKNERLEKLIKETEFCFGTEVSEEDLSTLFAAGDLSTRLPNFEEKKR